MLYLEPFFCLSLNVGMSRGCRWAGSAGGPGHRSASCGWTQGEDELVRTASPRLLRSSPPQMISRISLEIPDFSMGLTPRRGRRRGLRGTPPTALVPTPPRGLDPPGVQGGQNGMPYCRRIPQKKLSDSVFVQNFCQRSRFTSAFCTSRL